MLQFQTCMDAICGKCTRAFFIQFCAAGVTPLAAGGFPPVIGVDVGLLPVVPTAELLDGKAGNGVGGCPVNTPVNSDRGSTPFMPLYNAVIPATTASNATPVISYAPPLFNARCAKGITKIRIRIVTTTVAHSILGTVPPFLQFRKVLPANRIIDFGREGNFLPVLLLLLLRRSLFGFLFDGFRFLFGGFVNSLRLKPSFFCRH